MSRPFREKVILYWKRRLKRNLPCTYKSTVSHFKVSYYIINNILKDCKLG